MSIDYPEMARSWKQMMKSDKRTYKWDSKAGKVVEVEDDLRFYTADSLPSTPAPTSDLGHLGIPRSYWSDDSFDGHPMLPSQATPPDTAHDYAYGKSMIHDLQDQLDTAAALTGERARLSTGDPIKDAIRDSAMPSLYPTLTRRGLLVEMELPANTPPRVVLTINASTRLTRITDYRAEFPYRDYDRIQGILESEFGKVIEVDNSPPVIDPRITPITLFVEYVGQCRSRDKGTAGMAACRTCGGSGIRGMSFTSPQYNVDCTVCHGSGRAMSTPTSTAYASAWVDGGWNCRIEEPVLRSFFGDPVLPFNGDFFQALLEAKDISKAYKQFARRYHPDLNKAKEAVEQFHRLRNAYDTLKDPIKRKRYQAGLKFAVAATKVNEVVFHLPKTCGQVTVKGEWMASTRNMDWQRRQKWSGDFDRDSDTTRKILNVTEIVKWEDIFDRNGRRMEARWDRNNPDPFRRGFEDVSQKPFVVTWEDTTEFEIKVNV